MKEDLTGSMTETECALWFDAYTAVIPDECQHPSDSRGAWSQIEYAVNAADTAIIALRKRRAAGL